MNDAPLQILLVEDDPDFVLLTTAHLEAGGHAVDHVSSMHDALTYLDRHDLAVDALLLDLGLPDIEGLAGLRAAVGHVGLPVVVYTADGRADVRQQAADLGAAAFLVKGEAGPDELAAALDEVVLDARAKQRNPTAACNGAHDGLEDQLVASLEMLAQATPLPHWAAIRFDGVDSRVVACAGNDPRLVVGDSCTWSEIGLQAVRSPGTRLFAGQQAILSVDGTMFDPETCAVSPFEVDNVLHSALVGWCSDVVSLDDRVASVVTHIARQLATLTEIELDRGRESRRAEIANSAASADLLTGLGNRRAFQQFLRAEETRCRRYSRPAVVFILDLDRLKVINDEGGHAAGDRYLRAAASAMQDAVRGSDAVFRIGGDEFAIVAVECDVHSAAVLEIRLRELLAASEVQASIGWSARPPEATLDQAAIVADQKMYHDKHG